MVPSLGDTFNFYTLWNLFTNDLTSLCGSVKKLNLRLSCTVIAHYAIPINIVIFLLGFVQPWRTARCSRRSAINTMIINFIIWCAHAYKRGVEAHHIFQIYRQKIPPTWPEQIQFYITTSSACQQASRISDTTLSSKSCEPSWLQWCKQPWQVMTANNKNSSSSFAQCRFP